MEGLAEDVAAAIRAVERWLLSWRYTCPECRDTGWASYADKVGWRTYHVSDHCRKCRPRLRKTTFDDMEMEGR